MKHAKPRPRWITAALRTGPQLTGWAMVVMGAVVTGVAIGIGLAAMAVFGTGLAVAGVLVLIGWSR